MTTPYVTIVWRCSGIWEICSFALLTFPGYKAKSYEARHPRPRRRHQFRQRPVHQGPRRVAADPGKSRSDRAVDTVGLAGSGRHEPGGNRTRPVRYGGTQRDPREDAQGRQPGGRAHRGGVLLPRHGRIAVGLPKAETGDVLRYRRALERHARARSGGGRQPARPPGRGRGGGAADPRAHWKRQGDARRRRAAGGDGHLSGSRRRGAGAVSMIFLRSLVFLLAQVLITPPYAIFALA